MTRNEITRRFPKASEAFIRANLSIDSLWDEAPIVEPDPGHGALATKEVQGGAGKRFLIRITSFRKRLIDEDNLCEKFVVDLLRYSRIIPDDSPGICKIEVSQTKVGKNEEEKVLIEVGDLC